MQFEIANFIYFRKLNNPPEKKITRSNHKKIEILC